MKHKLELESEYVKRKWQMGENMLQKYKELGSIKKYEKRK